MNYLEPAWTRAHTNLDYLEYFLGFAKRPIFIQPVVRFQSKAIKLKRDLAYTHFRLTENQADSRRDLSRTLQLKKAGLRPFLSQKLIA